MAGLWRISRRETERPARSSASGQLSGAPSQKDIYPEGGAPVALQHQEQLGVHRVGCNQLCLVGPLAHAAGELARIVFVVARERLDGLLARLLALGVQL